MLHVKKEDQVRVLSGKDAGKEGRVLKVFPTSSRAIVENVNNLRRHTRPNPQKNVQGGVVEREAPIHIAKLKVICPECNKPVRTGIRSLSDGKKVRVCKSCDATIDK